jgi:hypothetical protein
MAESNCKIPILDKLTGASTYPEWIISIENYLGLVPAGPDHRVMGHSNRKLRETYCDHGPRTQKLERRKCSRPTGHKKKLQRRDAYAELKKAYEGKTASEFHALLDSPTSVSFDGQKPPIEEYVTNYECAWNCFVGVVSRADLTTDDGFWKGLQEFVLRDKANTESECFTKKRGQKVIKKTKASDDTEEEIYVGIVRVQIVIPGNLTGEY